jgi:hypothetical protein
VQCERKSTQNTRGGYCEDAQIRGLNYGGSARRHQDAGPTVQQSRFGAIDSRPCRMFMHCHRWAECPLPPHIARPLGRDVAVPRRGAASTKNLSQRPTEASADQSRPDRREVGLEVSSIDGVTLSDGEGRGRRRTVRCGRVAMGGHPVAGVQIRLICCG